MSVKDIRLMIGERTFLVRNVPFRNGDCQTLSGKELAENLAQRLAGSDSMRPFRQGDNARKAWEYTSQRKPVNFEIIEITSCTEEFEPTRTLQPKDIGLVILSTVFKGETVDFLVGLKASVEIANILDETGCCQLIRSEQVYQGKVIKGITYTALTELVKSLNERSEFRFDLPSLEFIKHAKPVIAAFVRDMGIGTIWLRDSLEEVQAKALIAKADRPVYEFGGLGGVQLRHAENIDFNLGVILEISRLKG